MSKTHEGYLLIADITGYTRYLSESELAHAQETLTALLQLLVEHTRPPLVISRLAGDAVISYGLRDNFFDGQTLIEKIETTYVTFRKAIERLVLNNTCQCDACANIGNLDLKFFVHFGAFGIQRISDYDELVGSDINLLHRLLKNSVTEETGIKAYALYTEAAVRQLDAAALVAGMTPHRETYEHLGDVAVWVQDMHPVWEAKRDAVSVSLPPEQVWIRLEADIDMPVEAAWGYLVRPEFRGMLIGAERVEVTNRADGRIAPGSVYQCYHGDTVVPQTILEWQPLESIIIKQLFPMHQAVSFLGEHRLEPIDGKTRMTTTFGKPSGPMPWRLLAQLFLPIFAHLRYKPSSAIFVQRIEADYRARRGAAEHVSAVTGEQIRAAAAAGLQPSAGNPPA